MFTKKLSKVVIVLLVLFISGLAIYSCQPAEVNDNDGLNNGVNPPPDPFTATVVDRHTISLNWDWLPEEGAISLELFRKLKEEGSWSVEPIFSYSITAKEALVLPYIDSGLLPDTEYDYRLIIYYQSGGYTTQFAYAKTNIGPVIQINLVDSHSLHGIREYDYGNIPITDEDHDFQIRIKNIGDETLRIPLDGFSVSPSSIFSVLYTWWSHSLVYTISPGGESPVITIRLNPIAIGPELVGEFETDFEITSNVGYDIMSHSQYSTDSYLDIYATFYRDGDLVLHYVGRDDAALINPILIEDEDTLTVSECFGDRTTLRFRLRNEGLATVRDIDLNFEDLPTKDGNPDFNLIEDIKDTILTTGKETFFEIEYYPTTTGTHGIWNRITGRSNEEDTGVKGIKVEQNMRFGIEGHSIPPLACRVGP